MNNYEATIRSYFAACNARDADAISSFFTTGAVHYFPRGDRFPDGTSQSAFVGGTTIGEGFSGKFDRENQTYWSVDLVMVDEETRQAVIEWSNFKPGLGPDARLRGTEWYRFDAGGLIEEIRAYYACPPVDARTGHELGGFDYRGRGYPCSAAETESSSGQEAG
jgi:hypothetical protein